MKLDKDFFQLREKGLDEHFTTRYTGKKKWWSISKESKHFLFGVAVGAIGLFGVLVWISIFYQ